MNTRSAAWRERCRERLPTTQQLTSKHLLRDHPKGAQTMICPECYAHVYRVLAYSLRTRLFSRFTPYQPFYCRECRWRGLLLTTGARLIPNFKQSLLGWFIGIVIAISIAWLVVGDLESSAFKPSDASAEIKWGW